MRRQKYIYRESVEVLKMNYFRGFKSVLGSPSAENQPSVQETVERLCDRVDSSTLLEDRRDAVRALKSLSKKFRLEVGTQSMALLIKVLETDRSDTEIVGMSLETLCNIMSTEPQPQDEQTPTKIGATQSDSDVGLQFTEIFIKNADNVSLLLGILEEYEFHVRWPTVKLLTMLLTNKPNLLQQCILISPMGLSRLMDLLSDSREIIRNEGLLLLIKLTKSNAAIQKIVAFENAFDRLFEIIGEEGYSDGGIVVEDCLQLMANLLRNNVSNQNFFREGSFIQRFTPFFQLSALAMQGEAETDSWSEQKVSNAQLMLKVVRVLVSPDNPQQATSGAQKIMNQSGLLKLLCDILMASGIPADILTEAINTVSEVIRGFPANQEYFSQVNAPSEPPRPAIVVLLMSMINDKQPFSLRCAVLYCFQCYLYKNEQGQTQIVSTLLPSSADVAASVSAGQLLCAGIFSMDPLSNWCAAVALSHCLKGNPTEKEQLLRVQLATSLGNPPVSLLQQCTNILAQGGDIQTRVGLLMLLCSWLSNCPIAVAHFLHNEANVPYLMAQVGVDGHGEEGDRLVGYLCALLLGLCLAFNDNSVEKFTKDDLRLLMNKRIGLDNLLEKIGYISKSEYFTSAVKSPEIKDDGTQQVLIDHEFTKLFKKLDAAVTKAVEETTEAAPTSNHQNDSIENHDSIVASYKGLIREQDEELCRLRSRLGDMESSYNQARAQLQHQGQEILQLRHQLSFAQSYQNSQQSELNGSYVSGDTSELLSLRNQMNDLQINKQDLEKRLQEKEQKVQKLEKDLEVAHAQYAVAAAAAELADSSDLLSSSLNKNQLDDLLGLRRNVSSLEHEVSMLRGQNTSLHEELDRLRLYGQAPRQAHERIQQLETRLVEMTEENDSQSKEHEDLLVLIADQDDKLALYKKKLKEAGHEVSADEEDDEDDDDDDDDEEEGEDDNEKDETVDEVVTTSPESVEESVREDTSKEETQVPSSGFHVDQVQSEEDTKAKLQEALQEVQPVEESGLDMAIPEEGQLQEESGAEVGELKHSMEEQQCQHTEVPHEEEHPSQPPGTDELEQFAQSAVQEQTPPISQEQTSISESQGNVEVYSQEEQRNTNLYSNQNQGQMNIMKQDQGQTNYYSNQDQGQMNQFFSNQHSGNTQSDFKTNGTQQGQSYNYYTMPSVGQASGQTSFFTHNTQEQANSNVMQQRTDTNTYGSHPQGYYKTDGSPYMQYPPNQMHQNQGNNTTAQNDIKQDAGLLLDFGDNSNDFLT